jgi:SAM-dependent methyltransferase
LNTAHTLHWEQIEIDRSDKEAAEVKPERLQFRPGRFDRFMNPPANTPQPADYCYHLLGNVEGLIALDLGCGKEAENSIPLLMRKAKVISMDIAPKTLEVAKQSFEVNGYSDKAKLIRGNAVKIPLATDSVDVVFGIAILHHLVMDWASASREVLRVLKPGGRAIFQEPVRDSRLLNLVRQLIPIRDPDVSENERPLNKKDFESFAKGFTGFHKRDFFLPYIRVIEKLPYFPKGLVAPVLSLDRWLLNTFPALGHFATVRVVELRK